nr:uncharacterized protein LOC128700797 [Cherax quadricarinatus]
MSETVRCEVCSELYQTDSRDPVLLPCGHTFCRTCIVSVQKEGDLSCPSCSQDISQVDAADLPVNIQALSLSLAYTKCQLPSEVFLELSNGQRCLGRVYIQLWCHMRRAQQFLALCLGTMGPSLVGAHFRSVSDADKERETIWCTEYASPDGGTGYRELMLDMEWDGEHRREPREGLVVAYSNDVNDYGFGICTKGKPGANFSSPFGEVSSGLEVVRAAVGHEPVTEVTITDCGLVIPDLTP